METKVRASSEQFSTLLEFIESHGDLSKPRGGPQGRLKSEHLWCQLATMLNYIGGGGNKSTFTLWMGSSQFISSPTPAVTPPPAMRQ